MTTPSMKYNPAFLDDEALIESFVSRHVELELILETIRENTDGSNQHVLLIGPRGIGKTTLALRVAAEIRAVSELRERWYPLTFGEESYGVSTPGEFWLEALFYMGEQTQDERWQQAHEELRAERDEDRLRQRALIQLMDFADEHDKRLLLIVENLNMLIGTQMSSDDAWTLRHTLMNEPRLMLLGTATSRFKEVEEYDQALYDLFKVVELDPFDDDNTRALWASIAGNTLSSTQIRPIRILTGGNPRLIRIISEFASDVSFGELMEDLIRLVDEHTEYFKHHLDRLPPKERKAFVALADLWDPSTARQVAEHARLDVNNASALLRRLGDRGAVTVPYKRGRAKYYQLAERMYNIYHLMRRRAHASGRVRAAVRFMTHLYRGERLVRTTRSLLEEAEDLDPLERRDHLMAYRRILEVTDEPELRRQLLEAAQPHLSDMPDMPASVLEMVTSREDKDMEMEAATLLEDLEEEQARLLDLHVEEVDDTETLLEMGQALSEQSDRRKEAEAAYRKALQDEPKNPVAWDWLGTLLILQGRYRKALEAFEQALVLDDTDAAAWHSKGFALVILGRHEEALAALEQALALDDTDAAAWRNKGHALYNLEHYGEALNACEQFLEHSNYAPDALNDMAWSFYEEGWRSRFPEAEAWARYAVEQEPKHGRYRLTLATLLSAQDRWTEALSHANAFLRDTDMVEAEMDTVIDFFVGAAAAGHGDEALEQILASPSAGLLEPLVMALRLRQDEEVNVAREIYEVARDVIDRIEARSAEMSQGAFENALEE